MLVKSQYQAETGHKSDGGHLLRQAFPEGGITPEEAKLMAVLLAAADIIYWVPAGTEKKAVTDPVLREIQKLKTLGFLGVWLMAAFAAAWAGYRQYVFALALGALAGTLSMSPLGYRFTRTLDTAFDLLGKGVIA